MNEGSGSFAVEFIQEGQAMWDYYGAESWAGRFGGSLAERLGETAISAAIEKLFEPLFGKHNIHVVEGNIDILKNRFFDR